MNRDNSDPRAPFDDITPNACTESLVEETDVDSPLSPCDYSPTPAERRLLDWLTQVAELPGKAAVRVALLLLQLATVLKRKQFIMMRSKSVMNTGMSRVAAYEGLRELETAGLVSVKRCRGRSPLVTIVETSARSDRE